MLVSGSPHMCSSGVLFMFVLFWLNLFFSSMFFVLSFFVLVFCLVVLCCFRFGLFVLIRLSCDVLFCFDCFVLLRFV